MTRTETWDRAATDLNAYRQAMRRGNCDDEAMRALLDT